MNGDGTLGVPFPSNALTMQLIGLEETQFGDIEKGNSDRKEIIDMSFTV